MCGILGVRVKSGAHVGRAAEVAALGLRRLRHRGQDGAGLVTSGGDERVFYRVRGLGVVEQVLTPAVYRSMPGSMAVAQTRYPTSKRDKLDTDPLRNVGPFYAETEVGEIALAHNGNLAGARTLRLSLTQQGVILQTATDTEIAIHLIARAAGGTFLERLKGALTILPIAYSFVIMTEEALWGVRDPKGIRPLVYGENEELCVLASETVALDILGVPFVREVEPGEIVRLDRNGLTSIRFAPHVSARPCIFEYVYFARPDNEGGAVLLSRHETGKMLARNYPIPRRQGVETIVVGVPDSGLAAALGYAEEAGLRYVPAFVRDHSGARAFMANTPQERELAARLKHSLIARLVEGKVVVMVDDSKVRGTTSTRLVGLIRQAGAIEVHERIASPPVVFPCYYGIDTPQHGELLAHQYPTCEAMAQQTGADSIAFVTIDELKGAVTSASGRRTFCDTCFTCVPLHG